VSLNVERYEDYTFKALELDLETVSLYLLQLLLCEEVAVARHSSVEVWKLIDQVLVVARDVFGVKIIVNPSKRAAVSVQCRLLGEEVESE